MNVNFSHELLTVFVAVLIFFALALFVTGGANALLRVTGGSEHRT